MNTVTKNHSPQIITPQKDLRKIRAANEQKQKELNAQRQDALHKLCASNPFVWASINNIDVMDGVKFTLENTPYLKDCIDFQTPFNPTGKFKDIVVKKGAQSRITTTMMIYILHSMLHRRFQKNVMY